jgi:GTPase SAR1 family protein
MRWLYALFGLFSSPAEASGTSESPVPFAAAAAAAATSSIGIATDSRAVDEGVEVHINNHICAKEERYVGCPTPLALTNAAALGSEIEMAKLSWSFPANSPPVRFGRVHRTRGNHEDCFNYDALLRIGILGGFMVGKDYIVHKYRYPSFHAVPGETVIGSDFGTVCVTMTQDQSTATGSRARVIVRDMKLLVQLWSEQYKLYLQPALTAPGFIGLVNGFIIVFDVTNDWQTIEESITRYYERIQRSAPVDMVVSIVGNKVDRVDVSSAGFRDLQYRVNELLSRNKWTDGGARARCATPVKYISALSYQDVEDVFNEIYPSILTQISDRKYRQRSLGLPPTDGS